MKSDKFWILLFGIIILGCLAVLLFAGKTPGNTAYIYSEGELVDIIELAAVREPYMITVYNAGGGFNIIGVEHGCIGVDKSDCKDGICVKQGYISNGLIPVICLPNRLMIRIESSLDIDGAAG